MKAIIKKILRSAGYELVKLDAGNSRGPGEIGSDNRPVGSMKFLLEDLKQRGLNCKTILDIGANHAHWSRMAKHIFPDARFCLIEPLTELKPELDAFCNEFHGSTYISAGAGPQKNKITLTPWDYLAGSSVLPAPQNDLKSMGKQREIEIISIDDLLSESVIHNPELIKIDIQGYELEALKGAERTFGHTEVYILEVSLFSFNDVPGQPVLSEVVQFMLERDYVVYDFPGFLRRPLDGALGQCDICFVKRNGFLRTSNDWG